MARTRWAWRAWLAVTCAVLGWQLERGWRPADLLAVAAVAVSLVFVWVTSR